MVYLKCQCKITKKSGPFPLKDAFDKAFAEAKEALEKLANEVLTGHKKKEDTIKKE